MKVLGARVDALTLAFRVTLDPAFSEALRERAKVARQHGRAAFDWCVRVPKDDSGVVASRRRLGELPARWADEALRGVGTEYSSKIWGELRFSRALKVWNIVNEPFFRMRIDAQAPGKTERFSDLAGETIDEAGWTVEIVFYAQFLADVGLEVALREAEALASLTGEVHEQRVRRIDLCADVAGWTIAEDDVRKLAKRPRAKWSKHLGAGDEGEWIDEDAHDLNVGADSFGRGSFDNRKVTGLAVGRGGAMMTRIYDKRCELERDEDRRRTEEARWTSNGWDGEEPVTRVEFQIRGVALAELGLRDPEVALEPETEIEVSIDRRGRRRERERVVGHRIATGPGDDGRARVHGLVDRLDWVWRTCLDWARLVVLERTRSGRIKPVSRLPDDPRWALLREVTFADARAPAPIKRFRARAAASSAQALGVSLSQAARDGELEPMSEDAIAYDDDPIATLRGRVRTLKLSETERIVDWLLDKFGSAAMANVHLAVRANAARLRFLPRGERAEHAARPPPRDGPGPRGGPGGFDERERPAA